MSTKKKLTIALNGMLIIEDQTTSSVETVINLSGKILRPMPRDEKDTVLISDDFEGSEGYGIKLKSAFGSAGQRFANVNDLLKYLAPVTSK